MRLVLAIAQRAQAAGVPRAAAAARGRAAARRRRAAARDGRHVRRERARQGARRGGGHRAAGRRRRLRASRRRRSAARPGVRSARYAGEDASDEENLAKLLREVPADGDRRVAYVCALALRRPPTASERARRGALRGDADPRAARRAAASATTPRSSRTTRPTAARWRSSTPAEKDAISHRGRAARALLERWRRRRVSRRRPALAAAAEAPAGAIGRRPSGAQAARGGGLDRLERDPDRAEARRRRDHGLDRDHHRGDPLRHRPDRLGRRLLLGPQGRRARRRTRTRTGTTKVENLAAAIEGMLILVGAGRHRLRVGPAAGRRARRSSRSASASR